MQVCSQIGETPTANVVLSVDGVEHSSQAQGDGAVDATFKAIAAIVESDAELKLFQVSSITSGTDAQGEVTVRLEKAGRVCNGLGADTDIVIASAKAYVMALNKLDAEAYADREHPQRSQAI